MADHFAIVQQCGFYLSLFDNARANLSDRLRICSGTLQEAVVYNLIWLVSSDLRDSRVRVDDGLSGGVGSVRTPSEAEATARASLRFSAAACRSFFIPLPGKLSQMLRLALAFTPDPFYSCGRSQLNKARPQARHQDGSVLACHLHTLFPVSFHPHKTRLHISYKCN